MLWHREKRVSEDSHCAADFSVHAFDRIRPLQKVLELSLWLTLVIHESPAKEDLTCPHLGFWPSGKSL